MRSRRKLCLVSNSVIMPYYDLDYSWKPSNNQRNFGTSAWVRARKEQGEWFVSGKGGRHAFGEGGEEKERMKEREEEIDECVRRERERESMPRLLSTSLVHPEWARECTRFGERFFKASFSLGHQLLKILRLIFEDFWLRPNEGRRISHISYSWQLDVDSQ